MARQIKKVYFPMTRLAELAARDGGITRAMALESAMESIGSMRPQADAEIENSIKAIEDAVAGQRQVPEEGLRAILRYGDQIVTLAGTFGYEALDHAAKSLCDLADGMLRTGMHDAAPVVVHIQTIRLMAPGGTALEPTHTEKMLEELAKVLKFFDFGSLAGTAAESGPVEESLH